MAGKKPGVDPGFHYDKAHSISCPLCGETVKSKGGLIGHAKHRHGLIVGSVEELEAVAAGNLQPANEGNNLSREPEVKIGTPSPSNKSLREQVERQKLEAELRRYGIPPGATPEDIAQKLGLGEMTEGIRDKLQGRAFNLGGDQLTPLQQMAQEAEALDKLRGINPGKQGGADGFLGGILGLATALGFTKEDIRGVVSRIVNPQRVDTSGVDLEGFKLPSDVSDATFQKVLDYKSNVEAAKLEKEGRDSMAKSWDNLFKALTPLILEKVGGIGGIPNGGAAPISGKLKRTRVVFLDGQPLTPGEALSLECPQCHKTTTIEDTTELLQGKPIPCQNEKCDHVWQIVEAEKPSLQKMPRQVKVKPPEAETIACVSCGGLVDISSVPTGETVVCAHCGEEIQVRSPGTPLPPLPVEKKGPETLEERNIRGGLR